ncbi:hypothetical protein EVAR_41274_1 [Eumeta japonica]|uniref:Uncharacterized protein n=1 Tax=Eumeta variegata TaxID=151549 RepID=A0A4C1XAM8_EUMVA|nr:hypothetical protein EVAR_41274_1 [Eumeta japonica]
MTRASGGRRRRHGLRTRRQQRQERASGAASLTAGFAVESGNNGCAGAMRHSRKRRHGSRFRQQWAVVMGALAIGGSAEEDATGLGGVGCGGNNELVGNQRRQRAR